MTDKAQFRWVPEAPKFPGYYAARTPVRLGKLGEKGTELGTTNIHDAHQFETKEACEKWISENSPPEWKATEHGFCYVGVTHYEGEHPNCIANVQPVPPAATPTPMTGAAVAAGYQSLWDEAQKLERELAQAVAERDRLRDTKWESIIALEQQRDAAIAQVAKLRGFLRQYIRAIDAIYSHSAAARSAVVQRFGTAHPTEALAASKEVHGTPRP